MKITLSNQSNEDADVLMDILTICQDASLAALLASCDSNGRNRAHISVAITQLTVRATKDLLNGGKELRKLKQAVELMRDVDSWTKGNILEILDGCKAACGLD